MLFPSNVVKKRRVLGPERRTDPHGLLTNDHDATADAVVVVAPTTTAATALSLPFFSLSLLSSNLLSPLLTSGAPRSDRSWKKDVKNVRSEYDEIVDIIEVP